MEGSSENLINELDLAEKLPGVLLIDDFNEAVFLSVKFLSYLRELSRTELEWPVVLDAIVRVSKARQNREKSFRGSSATRSYTPQDVIQAAENLCHPIKPSSNRKHYSNPAPTPSKRRFPNDKYDPVQSVLHSSEIDTDRVPSLAAFLEVPLIQGSAGESHLIPDSERPQVSPWQHWDQQLTFDTVFELVHADMLAASQISVWQGGRQMTPSAMDDAYMEAVRILRSISTPDTSALSSSSSYIMNTPADKLARHRTIPAQLAERTMLHQERSSANITPRGSFVDLHHDTMYGMETLWGGPKLWLFYPPSAAKLAALAATFGQQDRLQHEGETLLLPLYWPHATLALGGGVLAGSEAAFAEELPKELEHVGLDVRAARREERCPKAADARVKQHVKGLFGRLRGALLRCEDEGTRAAIFRTWAAQKEELLPLLVRYDTANKAAGAWMDVLRASGRGLDLVAHMATSHMKGRSWR
ncbi:hypothetical protein SLS54_008862 [Diplodia seriata]